MFRRKLLAVIILPLFFSGCAEIFGTSKTIPAQKKPAKQNLTAPREQMIKGVISDLAYNDSWCYTIKSTDTSNAKLSGGVFCADKYYFAVGDLVYATVINNKIKSMNLIKKGSLQSPKSKNLGAKKREFTKTKPAPTKKTIIEVPQTQKISFD